MAVFFCGLHIQIVYITLLNQLNFPKLKQYRMFYQNNNIMLSNLIRLIFSLSKFGSLIFELYSFLWNLF